MGLAVLRGCGSSELPGHPRSKRGRGWTPGGGRDRGRERILVQAPASQKTCLGRSSALARILEGSARTTMKPSLLLLSTAAAALVVNAASCNSGSRDTGADGDASSSDDGSSPDGSSDDGGMGTLPFSQD